MRKLFGFNRVPTSTAYLNPILQCLRGLGGSARIEELNSRVAESMGLSDEVLAVLHRPWHQGQTEFAYRMAWAGAYLQILGLITDSQRAVWSLTPLGWETKVVDPRAVEQEVHRQLLDAVRNSRGRA